MDLISLVVILIVVGMLLWLINNYLPMETRIKNILNIVVVIAVILWVLQAVGAMGILSRIWVTALMGLIVVGMLLWLVNSYLPMDARIKQILNIVVIIAVVLWLLGLWVIKRAPEYFRWGTIIRWVPSYWGERPWTAREATPRRTFIDTIGRTIMAWTIPVSLPTLGLMSALTSFDAFEGLGKDVKRGGEPVQDAARDKKEKM